MVKRAVAMEGEVRAELRAAIGREPESSRELLEFMDREVDRLPWFGEESWDVSELISRFQPVT